MLSDSDFLLGHQGGGNTARVGDTDTVGRAMRRYSCSSRSTPPSPPLRSLFTPVPPSSLSHAGVTFLNTTPPTFGTSMRWGGCQLRRATGASRSRGGNTVPGMPQPEGGRFKGGSPHISLNHTISKIPRCSHKTISGLCNLQCRWQRRDRIPCPHPHPCPYPHPHHHPHPHPRPCPRPHAGGRSSPGSGTSPRRERRRRPAVAATPAGSSLSPVPALSPPLVVGGEDAAAGGVVAVLGLAQAGGAALLLAVGRAGGHGGGRDAGCGMRGGRGN